VTTSNITAPSDGTTVTADDASPQNVSVSGTSDGGNTDFVQIDCYFGSDVATIQDSVPVQTGGDFSTDIPATNFSSQSLDQPCVLRAVPQPPLGDQPPSEPPGTTSLFTGPTIRLNSVQRQRVTGGPNDGKLRDYYLLNIQSDGGFDYHSTGYCGVYDSYLWTDVFAPTTPLFYCNDGTLDADGNSGPPQQGLAQATGSELKVDGANAYLAGALPDLFVSGLNPENSPGFPAFSVTTAFDPSTHAVTITESDTAVKCAPNSGNYPPDPSGCSSFVPTGIRLDRTIVQSHSGKLAIIRSQWSSTDGAGHHLQLELGNDQHSIAHDIAYEFPWISSNFQVYNDGALPGPPNGPGRIYVKSSLAAADGDTAHPRGVIVFAGPPKDIRFTADQTGTSTISEFLADYDFSVPAGGFVRTGFAYGDAFTQAEVTALGDAAQASFPQPSVSINPAGTSFSGTVTVSGRASDPEGLAGVSVNGTHAALAGDGSWTATVPLSPGHNTLTATATNLYGATAQASTQAGYAKLGLAGKPRAKGLFVVFKATCADAGVSCAGNALLVTKERVKGKRVLGLTAKTKTRKLTTGRKRFSVKPGATATIKVPLNKAARKLLARFHKLPVRVTVSVAAGGVTSSVGGTKVTFHARKKKHRHA
jgi:hypothetical protein